MSISLPKFTEDLNIIQNLEDQPTLTSKELKKEFDKAGNKIKDYLNNIFLTKLEDEVNKALGPELEEKLKNMQDKIEDDLTKKLNDLSDELRKQIKDLQDKVTDSLDENDDDIFNMKKILQNLIRTQSFSVTINCDSYSGEYAIMGRLAIPSGYTFLGLTSTDGGTPDFTKSYGISADNTVFCSVHNLRVAQTATMSCKAIYVKNNAL